MFHLIVPSHLEMASFRAGEGTLRAAHPCTMGAPLMVAEGRHSTIAFPANATEVF